MKTIIFLLISITATAQTAPYKVAPGPGPYVIKGKGYINLILEPVDTTTWEYTVTRKKVGTVTPPIFPAQIKIEAESSVLTTNVDKPTDGPTDHKAYIRPVQGWLPWSATYTVTFSKQNKILFMYANGNTSCDVTLNIAGVIKTITLPTTGTSWANAQWQSYSFDIPEQSGTKTITITYSKGINVDYFTVR